MIAREGRLFILIPAALALYVSWQFSLGVAVPLWLLCVIFIYLFRDPGRSIPPVPLAIVSPADGTVIKVEQVHDVLLKRQAICLRISIGMTDVYTVRSGVEGKVMEQWYSSSAALQEAREQDTQQLLSNVRFASWIQTDEGDDVLMCVSGGFPLSRPQCYVQSGERIGQGHRCGYVPFGACIDIYVPEESRILVEAGRHVTAGSDTLATLVHRRT
jgi:phosphatidylserine decarboxylase